MSTTATGGSTMIDRMIRAAKLENAVYEEVEHDQSATVQAFWVVVIASVAAVSYTHLTLPTILLV